MMAYIRNYSGKVPACYVTLELAQIEIENRVDNSQTICSIVRLVVFRSAETSCRCSESAFQNAASELSGSPD
jgi:hypothetical protein